MIRTEKKKSKMNISEIAKNFNKMNALKKWLVVTRKSCDPKYSFCKSLSCFSFIER